MTKFKIFLAHEEMHKTILYGGKIFNLHPPKSADL